MLLEPGRHSDAKSAAIEETPPAGSLSLWDLGYFCLKRFRRWTAAGAFWISRWQPGTVVLTPEGTPLDLLQRLRRHPWDGPLDIAVLLGSTARVACRLIALRVPPEVAARRRQKAYEKAQKSGRTPTRAHLQWCDWTILVTNCSPELLTWKEVVVLYRTRWQIELLFKLWKSHNRLATHAESQSVAWQMAEFWAKLIGVILQHWLLLTMTWLDCPAQPEESRHGAARLDHRAAGSAGRCRSALRRLEPNASRDRGRGPGQRPEEKAELVPTP